MSATVEVIQQLLEQLYTEYATATRQVEILERTLAELKGGRVVDPDKYGVELHGIMFDIKYALISVSVPTAIKYQSSDWGLDCVMRDQGMATDGGYYFYFWNSSTHQLRTVKNAEVDSRSETNPIRFGDVLYYCGCKYRRVR